jgi:exosortase
VFESSTAISAVSSNPVKYLGLPVLFSFSLALWLRPLASTLELALNKDAHTYILLILPLSVALIYIDTRPASPTLVVGRWIGTMLLGLAILLRAFTSLAPGHLSTSNGLSLKMFALVCFWIGAVISCLGVQAFRSIAFSMLFLFLLVPLPEPLVNLVTEFLQRESAVAADILFHAAQVPVQREGILLSIPGLDIEVAYECSSIRSSTMLVILTLVLAHLFLRSWWRQGFLVLAAIPLSSAKNAARIFIIAELGTRVDAGYLTGKLHHNGGVIFLCIALTVMILLMWLLRKGDVQSPVVQNIRRRSSKLPNA